MASSVSNGRSNSLNLITAAIDFGTTFSGYAFLLRDQSGRIFVPQWPCSGGKGFASKKTPSDILIDEDGKFVAFGYAAREKYDDLRDDDEHEEYYYFRKFKMELHKRKRGLSYQTEIKDINGKKLPAIKVFSMSIQYLKDEVIKQIQKAGPLVTENDINWVLTVPAIWDEQAKYFMRKAAEEAGIPGNHLILALEPEAASVYAKEINVRRSEKDLSPYEPGTKFMVLDLGGGTVDITVRQVAEDHSLKELYVACGNDNGGDTVNKEIYDFLIQTFGKEQIEKFIEGDSNATYDLDVEIEKKKRIKKETLNIGSLTLDIPGPLREHALESKCELMQSLRDGKFANTVTLIRQKLKLNPSVFIRFFKKSGNGIISLMKKILSSEVATDLKDIIMVGGLADSFIIRDMVKKEFPNLTFVIPDEAELVVLKGAVLYGNNPNIVSERLNKFTYGTEIHRFFLDGDDEKKKIIIGGMPYCMSVFNKLAEIGQPFKIGDVVKTEIYPLKADMTKMSVKFYQSSEQDPKYVDSDRCTYLGKIVVDMPDISGGLDRCVNVFVGFGDTELKITAQDECSGSNVDAELKLLD